MSSFLQIGNLVVSWHVTSSNTFVILSISSFLFLITPFPGNNSYVLLHHFSRGCSERKDLSLFGKYCKKPLTQGTNPGCKPKPHLLFVKKCSDFKSSFQVHKSSFLILSISSFLNSTTPFPVNISSVLKHHFSRRQIERRNVSLFGKLNINSLTQGTILGCKPHLLCLKNLDLVLFNFLSSISEVQFLEARS